MITILLGVLGTVVMLGIIALAFWFLINQGVKK